MPLPTQALLEPRKLPVQARSAASVEAMLEATTQVLVAVGKERLTTKRVAERAGVSVGTLYQYFPNKSSLLQAVLRRHFEQVSAAVNQVCEEQKGRTLGSMACALVTAFLEAKVREPRSSAALYTISSDVDGQKLATEVGAVMHRMISAMLATAVDGPPADPGLVTTVVQGAMAGVSRRLLESNAPEQHLPPLREELIAMVSGYLEGCPRRNTAVFAKVRLS